MAVPSIMSVVPIKGTADDLKPIASVSNEDAARRRGGIKIIGVGTNYIKTHLFDSLRFVKPDPEQFVPNACHFPEYTLDYFRGLCSEERLITDTGKVHFQKKGNIRNEPLDCRVYAVAASIMCGIDRFQEQHWRHLESKVTMEAPVLPTMPKSASLPAPSRRVRGSFL
jgi:phage terminase large subunit GpA-like protein